MAFNILNYNINIDKKYGIKLKCIHFSCMHFIRTTECHTHANTQHTHAVCHTAPDPLKNFSWLMPHISVSYAALHILHVACVELHQALLAQVKFCWEPKLNIWGWSAIWTQFAAYSVIADYLGVKETAIGSELNLFIQTDLLNTISFHQIPLARSEGNLLELMEEVCERMEDYGEKTDPSTNRKSYIRVKSRNGEAMDLSEAALDSRVTASLKFAVSTFYYASCTDMRWKKDKFLLCICG